MELIFESFGEWLTLRYHVMGSAIMYGGVKSKSHYLFLVTIQHICYYFSALLMK